MLLAACGSDSNTESTSAAAPATAAPAATNAPATTAADATETSAAGDSTETSTAGTTGAPETGDFSVGIALGAPKNDQAYFQSVFEGASSGAETAGAEFTVIDNLTDETAAGDAIRNLSDANKLVVADITLLGALIPVAQENPDVQYIVTSGFFKDGDVPANVHGYVTVYGWPAYPMGVIAATISKSAKLGYITGPTFPIERTALAGFKAGAQSVNPDIQVVETVIDSYSDVPGAKNAASAQIASGVDVLYGFIDAAFVGLQQAADESGKDVKLFSPVVDRCDRGDNIVGNNVSDIKAMTASAVNDFVTGNLPLTNAYGLEDEKIQYFNLCSGFQTPDLTSLADKTVASIKDGSLELPAEVTAGS
jgi:basic membrane lipoprotein Med (substrate-binding protein (PBP1-ABC) superfamily)